MDVRGFYDDFVDHQVQLGVNDRHRAILAALERAGLANDDRVLEIGCGIGTFTELIASALGPRGSILAVDISERSIEVARERLPDTRVKFVAGDVVDTEVVDAEGGGVFDAIVCPDVIEHIPLDQHSRLFAALAAWLSDDGFILCNYPNPHYLEWCHVHRPDVLQVIDQPIHADVLVANTYPHGLYLDYLETYSIWIREGDYVRAVLRPRAGVGTFTQIPDEPPSLIARGVGKMRRILRG